MKTFMNLRFGAMVAVLLVAVGLVACGGGGGSDDVGPTGTVPTAPVATPGTPAAPATSWWQQAVVHPIGEKVVGMNQLSAAAMTIGDAAWQQAVKDGTVKVVDTGAIMTGFSSRPFVWTVFQRGTGYCTTPVYKDDGGAIGAFTSPGSMCTTEPSNWFMGTADGIKRFVPSRGECYSFVWNPVSVRFDDLKVSCQ
jgi:hypothetical protein